MTLSRRRIRAETSVMTARVETRVRALIVQDPASAPQEIVKLVLDTLHVMRMEDRRKTLKPFLIAASVALAVAVLVSYGAGVVIGHWVWR